MGLMVRAYNIGRLPSISACMLPVVFASAHVRGPSEVSRVRDYLAP